MINTPPPPPPPPGPPGRNPSFGQVPPEGPGQGKSRKRTLLIAVLALVGVAALSAVGYFVVLPLTGLTATGNSNDDAVAQEPAGTSPKPTPAPSASASEEPEKAQPSVAMASAVPSREPSAGPSPSSSPEPSESDEPTSAPEGDLGLSKPVTQLECTDQYVVFYASSFVPESYESEIQGALDAHPGTDYVRSLGSCTTLNQMSDHDTYIYSVYSGPYDSLSEACAVSASSGVPDSYVKVLSSGLDPDEAVQSC